MQCITIEIVMSGNRNIMISCIYQAPSYDITMFKEWIEKVYAKTEQKVMFICGDFNIDLLITTYDYNCNHKLMEESNIRQRRMRMAK